MKTFSAAASRAAVASLALFCAAQAAFAEPKIENLKNPKTMAVLSEDAIRSAEPMPSPEFSPSEVEQMQQRFRELNPDIRDIVPGSPYAAPLAEGVPEKVADPAAKAPYWSAGKLYIQTAPGKLASCTAQFVEDKRVILTAAHCVVNPNTGKWYEGFVFKRADVDGVAPQTVGWRCVSIFETFHKPDINEAYDYAFILADADDERAPLTMTTGAPASSPLTAIGYPGNQESGKYMYQVDGQWASVAGGIVTMAGNPMRKGNSGGAWFTDFEAGGAAHKNRVISLNSFHTAGKDTEENGPLFTGDTLALREHVRQAKCLE